MRSNTRRIEGAGVGLPRNQRRSDWAVRHAVKMLGSSGLSAPAPPEQDDVVILVHGSFAGDKARTTRGERWWQPESPTWNWLNENLPPGVSLSRGKAKI